MVRYRAVLAGCGAMSRGWLKAIFDTPQLRDQIEIVGLNDLRRPAAEAIASDFHLSGADIDTDLDALLERTKPELLFDVVIPGARQNVVALGLRHGCNVLSEKPMATSLADARALIEDAQSAGRVHAVIQNRRYNAGIRRIKALLDSGALGTLTSINADFFVGAHFGGFREEMRNVLLLDMAIHTFDAARFLAGSAPQAAYCHESNPAGSWYAHGAAANALFEFENGLVFSYRGSWSAEGANTSWDAAWRLVGTKGTLLWDGEDEFAAHVVDGEEGFFRPLRPVEVPEVPEPEKTHGHASVILDFVSAIGSGHAPETVGSDNIKSLAMVFAAIESASQQQRIAISV
ncbi:oxidoreductase [Devosia pacifica]|uniref:Oxidoreductase n=1 Tax=Devosia pacifica TaxID=1335967 RepID=A0A918S3A7_9HYPH|nr:Gfo/Idh/MocA family oxidoreductase [Devosia pacifica]GHA18671.1 oxidoreductase [Devosia pacifica]